MIRSLLMATLWHTDDVRPNLPIRHDAHRGLDNLFHLSALLCWATLGPAMAYVAHMQGVEDTRALVGWWALGAIGLPALLGLLLAVRRSTLLEVVADLGPGVDLIAVTLRPVWLGYGQGWTWAVLVRQHRGPSWERTKPQRIAAVGSYAELRKMVVKDRLVMTHLLHASEPFPTLGSWQPTTAIRA